MTKETVKQIQGLLHALGNSPGEIDGEWGRKSQAALDATCQEYGVGIAQNATTTPAATDNNVGGNGDFWKDIRHFTREEFRCPCGKCGGFPVEPDERIVRFLEKQRSKGGVWENRPVTIIPLTGDPHAGGSGIRCKEYNASLPGSVYNSRHLEGKAVDIQVRGLSPDAVKMYLDQCVRSGELRYCYICGSSVHMDVL